MIELAAKRIVISLSVHLVGFNLSWVFSWLALGENATRDAGTVERRKPQVNLFLCATKWRRAKGFIFNEIIRYHAFWARQLLRWPFL